MDPLWTILLNDFANFWFISNYLFLACFDNAVAGVAEVPQQGLPSNGGAQGAGQQPRQKEDEQAEAHHPEGEGRQGSRASRHCCRDGSCQPGQKQICSGVPSDTASGTS